MPSKKDSPDCVLYLREQYNEWAYLCSHCATMRSYSGRERAYVWDKATEHLVLTHGLRRSWVETVTERAPVVTQVALPLILDHLARRNSSGV